VAGFIAENFIPVKIHIKENKEAFNRFGATWTPTLIVMDPAGVERHRMEGFLPRDEFLPQLEFGLGKTDMAQNQFAEAEQRFRKIERDNPRSAIAPEALYWAGVAKYKGANDPGALKETANALRSHYAGSVWAKKAEVWAS
jgi:hypothetical protein